MNLKIVKLQALLCGLLALILAAEWGYGEFAGHRLQEILHATRSESVPPSELPKIAALKGSADQYAEMVERPLFVDGRKPVVETVVETGKDAENGQIDDWELSGIYTKDNRQLALFSKKNEAKKYMKIGAEQSISDWILKEIHPDHVILQQAAEQKSVLLRKPRQEIKSAEPGKPFRSPKPVKPAKPAVRATSPNPENDNDDQKN